MSGGALTLLALFDRFVDGLVAIVRLVCIVLAIALFVIVVAAIVARYGFGQAVSWTEEVPRYLLIWISFLAAAVCVLKRDHVGFDVLFNALPPTPAPGAGVFISLLIFGFGWIMFRYGIVFVQDFGSDLMETIPYTNYWYYPAMPISGFLIMVFAVKLIVDDGRGIVEAPPSPARRWTSADDPHRFSASLFILLDALGLPISFAVGVASVVAHVPAAGRRQRDDRPAHADVDQHLPAARRHLLRLRRAC